METTLFTERRGGDGKAQKKTKHTSFGGNGRSRLHFRRRRVQLGRARGVVTECVRHLPHVHDGAAPAEKQGGSGLELKIDQNVPP
jgi:hypothetical protein